MLDPTPESTTTSTTSSFSPVVLSHKLSVKLDSKFFLLWHPWVLSTIKGHQLQKYMDFFSSIQKKLLNEANQAYGTINSAYIDWERQVNLLYSWLFSSMTESMLIRVVGSDSCVGVWDTLEISGIHRVYDRISSSIH